MLGSIAASLIGEPQVHCGPWFCVSCMRRSFSIRCSEFASEPTGRFRFHRVRCNDAYLDVIALGAFEQSMFEIDWPGKTRSSIIRVWQREQRGRSKGSKNWWDEVMVLPARGGSITGSLSPMAADGWAVIKPPYAPGFRPDEQYCSATGTLSNATCATGEQN